MWKRRRQFWVRLLATLALVGVWASAGRADEGHDHGGGTGDGSGGGSTTTTSTTAPPGTSPPTTNPSMAPDGYEPPPPMWDPKNYPVNTTPGARRSVMRYGPYTIPGATNPETGGHGHSHTGNVFVPNVAKPCTDCYITGMTARLTYTDGREANWNTDAQLHHMVLFNAGFGRSDATCGTSLLGFLGERFFAAGNERTPMRFPRPYGYYVGRFDTFNMIYELAGTSTQDQQVIIEMTYDWVPSSTPGMKRMDPVWLDIDQCGDSEYEVPAGPSSRSWTWRVNRPGKLIGLGGHLHDGGTWIDVVHRQTGQLLCRSFAFYGGDPAYRDHHGVDHLSAMWVCGEPNGFPIAELQNGQEVTITAHYQPREPVPDAMGIVIMWVGRS
ncbi:MAG: hypothetical protein KatS3mg008_2143 [Acidimicrobiales bacterium]|nr:MAG: hypothetical protein KatS3mg008_2143 [Acidimicrobiales bacterium]